MHAYNHVGIVVRGLVIKAHRALDLVNAFALQHSSRVEVDMLESRSNVVLSTATLRPNLVLGVV
jgi:hypothetical protein